MEVEACYSYGFLPADADRGGSRQQPPPPPYGYGHRQRHGPPPPPHPAPADEDGELWEYFPCPFCYIEVEVPFICSHLQEEHCFDTRNAVCPICANNLGRDMAAHFRVEHSHLLKRRKPSKPAGKGTGAATYQEQEPAPDPLLSHFICSSSSVVEVEQTHHDATDDERCTRNALGLQERLQRIDFLTEILTSTIL